MFSDVTKIKSLSVGLIHLLSELKFIYKVNEGLFFFLFMLHIFYKTVVNKGYAAHPTQTCHK